MNARHEEGAASELTFRMKRVRVAITGSTIEQALASGDFDAVVSSDDTTLAMATGVAATIRAAAGDAVQDEAARLLPAALGDVVVTSAGHLNTTFIFHAITRDSHRRLSPSELTLRTIARAVFRRSEDLGIKRIALPPLDGGARGLPAIRSAQLMLEALAEHASYPSTLLQVAFCLPEGDTRRDLIAATRELLTTDSHGALNWRDAWEETPALSRGPRPSTAAKPGDAVAISPPATTPVSDPTATGSPWLTSIVRKLRGQTEEADPHKSVQSNLLDLTGPPADPQSAAHGRRMPSRGSQPLLNNRYVLLEELGRGGMGVVHLAWDLVLRHAVAVKIVLPGGTVSPVQVQALEQETALQMNVAHPGIVRLFHFEAVSGAQSPYLVMEYVPWPTAEQWIADAGSSGLSPGAVLHVGGRLCEALATAHAHGALHLDIKPGNVFIDPDGKHPKLGDFGIAKSLGPRRAGALVTRPVGSPRHAAPEQTTRDGEIGPWTDVYLLAGTLRMLLTGHRASEDRDESTDPATAAALDVVNHGLAQSVEERPRDAAAFGSLLAAASATVGV